MTRRIIRAIFQLGVLVFIILVLVFFLDNRFRVLPSAIHNHLPVHNPGLTITDITIKECSSLNPFSSCKLDPREWHRIDKDLYLGKGLVNRAYIHTKRKREKDLLPEDKVVVDAKVSRVSPGESVKTRKDEQWERRPGNFWILRSAKRHDSDSRRAITAVDALFGSDAVEARIGWQKVNRALELDGSGSPYDAHITLRRGPVQKAHKPVPRIRRDGKFKIMQAADLHLSTGPGACRDVFVDGKEDKKCQADPKTIDFVNRMLDEEKPDLVVLTGDQVNGDTAPDVSSAIYKYAKIFIDRQIPYATIFGNHDDQGPLTRSQSMSIIEPLPYSLSDYGPIGISGIGNYAVEVLAPGSNAGSALTLYFLDTHGNSPDEKRYPGYAWLKPDQIDWFSSRTKALRGKHDRYAKIHMDMAFIHIPLPEYGMANPERVVGTWREKVMAPGLNTRFRDALAEAGVVAVSCGHDHVNDFCALERVKEGDSSLADHRSGGPGGGPKAVPPPAGGRGGNGRGAKGKAANAQQRPSKAPKTPGSPELWMCYGGGAGFGGYGRQQYTRRMRFFEIDANNARIYTWKRLESGEGSDKRIDQQMLAEGGVPIGEPGN